MAKILSLNQEWIEQGAPPDTRARKAWRLGHEARLRAREMMEDQAEVELLRQRDIQVYGNPDGPSFEHLFQQYKKEGMTDTDAYERIITGAKTTNPQVDQKADDEPEKPVC